MAQGLIVKMKLNILIIIILFFSTIISSQTVEEIKEALEYYPLHVGDYWQYEVTRKLFGNTLDSTWIGYKEVITDTLMPNGNRYYLVREEKLPFHNRGYIRVDSTSANIYEYVWGDYEELAIDSLLAQKGDTLRKYNDPCYICTEDTIKRYFDMDVEKTRRVEQYCISTTSYDGWELAKGLGEVMRYYDDIHVFLIRYECNLIYAKINGQEFGTRSNIEEMMQLPDQFLLMQNHPNPFNTVTTISYYLPLNRYIELSVFDLRGKEVAVLVNQEQSSGKYQMHFDATELNSGIYTYRLLSNEISISKKMLLLR